MNMRSFGYFNKKSIVSTAMPSSIRKLFRDILEDNSY